MTLFSNLDNLQLISYLLMKYPATTSEFFVYTLTFVQIQNFITIRCYRGCVHWFVIYSSLTRIPGLAGPGLVA